MKERIRVRLGAETVLVFGPESVSYERSRRENRTILREISARVFFGKIPKIKKNQISNISRISGKWKKIDFQYFQATRQSEKPDFQYFQDMRKLLKSNFQIFPGEN